MDQARPMLICSPSPVPDCGEAVCGECGVNIYPTLGSLRFAQEHGMGMICTRCAVQGPDYIFGGLMHHGRMVPLSEDQIAELLGSIERQAHSERQDKSKSEKRGIQ